MKIKEVRELETKDLLEKLENTVEKLHQLKLTHSIAHRRRCRLQGYPYW